LNVAAHIQHMVNGVFSRRAQQARGGCSDEQPSSYNGVRRGHRRVPQPHSLMAQRWNDGTREGKGYGQGRTEPEAALAGITVWHGRHNSTRRRTGCNNARSGRQHPGAGLHRDLQGDDRWGDRHVQLHHLRGRRNAPCRDRGRGDTAGLYATHSGAGGDAGGHRRNGRRMDADWRPHARGGNLGQPHREHGDDHGCRRRA